MPLWASERVAAPKRGGLRKLVEPCLSGARPGRANGFSSDSAIALMTMRPSGNTVGRDLGGPMTRQANSEIEEPVEDFPFDPPAAC